MRMFFLIALCLPGLAAAAEWAPLGQTHEANILLDTKSVEMSDGKAKAWLKFAYRKTQPPQTISRGKPFDSTTNLYYLDCAAMKYQVLDLLVFNKNEQVGEFHQPLNVNELDQVKLNSGVLFLMKRVCPNAASLGVAGAQ